MNSQKYQENRARFPHAELAKLHGQWVAFSMDGSRIVACNEDLATLDSLVVAAGEDPECVAYERVDDLGLGGSATEMVRHLDLG